MHACMRGHVVGRPAEECRHRGPLCNASASSASGGASLESDPRISHLLALGSQPSGGRLNATPDSARGDGGWYISANRRLEGLAHGLIAHEGLKLSVMPRATQATLLWMRRRRGRRRCGRAQPSGPLWRQGCTAACMACPSTVRHGMQRPCRAMDRAQISQDGQHSAGSACMHQFVAVPVEAEQPRGALRSTRQGAARCRGAASGTTLR